MKKQIIRRFLLIVFLMVISLLVALPSHTLQNTFGENRITRAFSDLHITLGLDLAGGTELDYKIDLSDAIAQNNDDNSENDVNLNSIAESVRDALEARVNPTGVGEIVVQRSQVDGDEHIIIQMPPSTNVAEAKKDAEKDNRLEFFEEDPEKLKNKRKEIATILTELTPQNWDQKTAEITQKDPQAQTLKAGPFFEDEILDPALSKKIMAAEKGTILQEIIETQTDMETTISDDGEMEIVAFPKPILALVHVTDKVTEQREKNIEATAEARHILFGYQGATRAAEDVPYATKEEAKAKAEEILAQLKENGTENFADRAKEYSTGPTGESGGSLGEFKTGEMAGPFNDAVFNADGPGLISEVIETDFGFHIIDVQSLTPAKTITEPAPKATYQLLYWEKENLIWTPTDLGGSQLENAVAGYNEIGQYLVNLLFDNEGAELFGEITERVAARSCEGRPCRLGIQVGGEWITQPTVREKINSRTSQITGQFTAESARQLADDLNLGAIDAPVTLSGQMSITPELGHEQLSKSLKAGLFGFVATMLFMLLLYKFAGVVAVISLSLYALLFGMLLKIWPDSFGGPIVLTLSGIAGVVLSLGLAVDGNILIFERMKEELARGRSLTQAVDLGFERAWIAIRDSNLTTLLSCFILFSLGNSLIKGFAITLIVGTLLSMFTAVTISRNLLRFALLFDVFKKKSWYGYTPKVQSAGSQIRKRK